MLNITIHTDDRDEAAETLEEIADLIRCGKENLFLENKEGEQIATIQWRGTYDPFLLLEISFLVQRHFKHNKKKSDKWMNESNPLLGNVSPVEMIQAGRAKKLLKFIINQIEENGGFNGKSTKKS